MGLTALYAQHSLIQTLPADKANPCRVNPCPYMCLLSNKYKERSCVLPYSKRIFQDDRFEEELTDVLLVGYHHHIYQVNFTENSSPTVEKFLDMNLATTQSVAWLKVPIL